MGALMQRQFRHDGRSLEVRAELLTHAWHVGIFEAGIPVIGGIARCSRRDVESAASGAAKTWSKRRCSVSRTRWKKDSFACHKASR